MTNDTKFTSRKVVWDMTEKRLHLIGNFDNVQQEMAIEIEELSRRFELRTYAVGTSSALLEIFPNGVIRHEGNRMSVELWEVLHD